jgi:hypothetical protein
MPLDNHMGDLVRLHTQATRAGKLGEFDYSVVGQSPFTIALVPITLEGNGWITPPAWSYPFTSRRNDQRFQMEIRGNDGTFEGEDLTDTYTGPLPSVADFVSDDSSGKVTAKFAIQFFLRNPSPGDPDPRNKAKRTYGYLAATPTLTPEGGSGPLPNVQEFKSFLLSVPGPVGSTTGGVDVADLEAKVEISIHGAVPAPLPGPARKPTVVFTVENLTGPTVAWGISEFYFSLANDDFILGSVLRLREEPSHYVFNRNL